jgi:hypothetical protein
MAWKLLPQGAIMPKYWCVNFDSEYCLEHGIKHQLWMMQYQFEDHRQEFQSYKPGAISRNWKSLGKISEGDWFIAYLKKNRYFAIGKVREPRRLQTPDDPTKTIAAYLADERSHNYKTGYIYYTPVFYENFSDEWRHPRHKPTRYPQRIDVEEWQYFIPEGIIEGGLQPFVRKNPHLAVVRVDRPFFLRIKKRLMEAQAADSGDAQPGDDRVESDAEGDVDDSVVEVGEESRVKRQGFRLDKKLRDALEQHAMDAAKRFFTTKGYDVDDHHKDHPYDLLCTKKGEGLFVEVKGTEMGGKSVILTAGEVEFARRNKDQMALFVLHSIKVSPDGKARGGKIDARRPWNVGDGMLRPISYWYDLP